MDFNIKQNVLDWLGATSQEEIKRLQKTVKNQEKLLDETLFSTKTSPSGLAIEAEQKDTTQSSGIRVNVVSLQKLYFNNQYIFRAVNVRANELITRGYSLIDGDKIGKQKCEKLLENSGDILFLKQWSVNTDVWGCGWLEKVYSKDGKEIVKLLLIHPGTFGWKTVSNHMDIIDIGSDKLPKACQQKYIDENGMEHIVEIDKKIIELLTFNKIADEFVGVGIVQPVFNTITRLMNMEAAAATAAVKAANPVWVGVFDTVSEATVRKWAFTIGRMTTKEQIFLPRGTDIKLISPERQLFSEYSEYYVDAVIAGTGVPKSLLLGRSGDTNRAESIVHSRHFQSLIETNQKAQENIINKIFIEYGKLANFDPPKFKHNEILENADLLSDKAERLFIAGVVTREEAREMIGLEEAAKDGTFYRNENNSVEKEEKKEERKAYFPSTAESPKSGSQKNIKRREKASPYSTVKKND